MLSDQITDPDRFFNDLAPEIGDKYMEIGIELGLPIEVLTDELETGRYMMLQASKKALRMLHLWQQSANEKQFTHSVLDAALKKHCACKGNHMKFYTCPHAFLSCF